MHTNMYTDISEGLWGRYFFVIPFGLKLMTYPMMSLNSCKSSCINLPHAGLMSMNHHAQLLPPFKQHMITFSNNVCYCVCPSLTFQFPPPTSLFFPLALRFLCSFTSHVSFCPANPLLHN